MNHLIFNIKEIKAKTNVYDVISNYDKTLLGKIYWHSPWRQYVFEPNREVPTIWSDDCLLELFTFMHKLKGERNKGIISIDPYNGDVLNIKKYNEDILDLQKEAVDKIKKIVDKKGEKKNGR